MQRERTARTARTVMRTRTAARTARRKQEKERVRVQRCWQMMMELNYGQM